MNHHTTRETNMLATDDQIVTFAQVMQSRVHNIGARLPIRGTVHDEAKRVLDDARLLVALTSETPVSIDRTAPAPSGQKWSESQIVDLACELEARVHKIAAGFTHNLPSTHEQAQRILVEAMLLVSWTA